MEDYEPLSNFEVNIPDTTISGGTVPFGITILPDTILEGDHAFTVSLDSSDDYCIGDPSSLALTITDTTDRKFD